jgi:hypothetical protein
MPAIKICSFNLEWMNDWFTQDAEPAAFRPTFKRDGHTNNTHRTVRVTTGRSACDLSIEALYPKKPTFGRRSLHLWRS